MGQSQSRSYPGDPNLTSGRYDFTQPREPQPASAAPSTVDMNTRQLLELREAQIDSVFKKMKSNLEMYMLYDNFDSKNEVILLDLKKKATNQEEELKQILESRDKLMAEFQTIKDDTNDFKSKDNSHETVNTILFLLLIASIIFIIYKIYTYPLDKNNINNINNNGVNIDKLLDLDNADLNNLSENDLNALEKAFDTKINQIENNINNTNNIKSSSNKSNSSKLNNSLSVNNITNTNLKKRNKLTL